MGNVIVVGHRGFAGQYPENTILSFKKAIEIGVDFIEIDVRESKDGKLVVIHDESINRTTDGKGVVREMTYKEIEKYDAGIKSGYPGEKIPLLSEVFEETGDKVKILIEVKECEIEKLIELIERYKMEERVFVGSFNIEYLKEIRQKLPVVSTALISENIPYRYLTECIELGIRKIDVAFPHLNKGNVKELAGAGFLVNAWTPNKKQDLEKVVSYGVHFITTDRPDVCLSIIKE